MTWDCSPIHEDRRHGAGDHRQRDDVLATRRLYGRLAKLATWVATLGLNPLLMLFMMMAFPFVWCMFCDQIALLIVIIPIYQPLLKALEFDPVWFWTLMLLNVTVGGMTPPFGYTMFAFKGSAPECQWAPFSARHGRSWGCS